MRAGGSREAAHRARLRRRYGAVLACCCLLNHQKKRKELKRANGRVVKKRVAKK
jgi:hypothetical protein